MKRKTEYDSIADIYLENARLRDDREMVLVPSARQYLGDIRGAQVLDLACGNGYYTRLIKDWGADEVVGLDISPEMIKQARDAEDKRMQGIQFQVADVATMPPLGQFDVVFAAFLLHYAPSVAALESMCQHIAGSLKEGGRFVSFVENPRYPVHSGRKYDAEALALDPIRDGSRIKRTHYQDDKKVFEFSHSHYEAETYERCLKSSGLRDIQWQNFVLKAGVPREPWTDFLRYDFSIIVLTARRR